MDLSQYRLYHVFSQGIRRHKDAVSAAVLLLGLLLILLLPTIKSLWTVEINPESPGFPVAEQQLLARNVGVSGDDIDYVIVWVVEKYGDEKIAPADYADLQLRVSLAEGSREEVRTVGNPSYIMREGRPALVFHIETLPAQAGERYDFTLQQSGSGKVKLHYPFEEQILDGESVVAAMQLAERKNWITSLVDRIYAEELNGKDIAMYLHRGKQIVSGSNPYSCVQDASGCLGYPAHLPLMYWFASGLVLLGADHLEEWTQVWRPISFASWFAVGLVLLVHLYRKGLPALAVAAFAFWLFNRWSIYVLHIAHTDFLGTLFLLLAVLLAERRPKAAAIVFGVSLAIKQVALLAAPFFLIMLWRYRKQSFAKLVMFTGLVVLVPVLTLLPFLIDNAPATMQALLYPAERPSQSVHGFASSFAQVLDVTDTSKLYLMVFLIGIVYIAAWRKNVTMAGGMLMIFAIMLSFTHVLYNQYVVWMLPLIPLAIVPVVEFQKRRDLSAT